MNLGASLALTALSSASFLLAGSLDKDPLGHIVAESRLSLVVYLVLAAAVSAYVNGVCGRLTGSSIVNAVIYGVVLLVIVLGAGVTGNEVLTVLVVVVSSVMSGERDHVDVYLVAYLTLGLHNTGFHTGRSLCNHALAPLVAERIDVSACGYYLKTLGAYLVAGIALFRTSRSEVICQDGGMSGLGYGRSCLNGSSAVLTDLVAGISVLGTGNRLQIFELRVSMLARCSIGIVVSRAVARRSGIIILSARGKNCAEREKHA